MRIAVLGAGTAGHMAVAHVARYLPDAALTHFYDPQTPAIGVGEGTTPVFTDWAQRVMGWDFAYLQAHCDATPKLGIEFEGWGSNGTDYTHFFGTAEGVACHISAALLSAQLATHSSAEVISQRVRSVTVNNAVATLAFDSGEREFDFVFDARGFPDTLTDEHVPLRGVPTNAAILTRGQPVAPRDRTRAVARPYGWIFVIPLRTETAYGYIHGYDQVAHARSDFETFLAEEGVEAHKPFRSLQFPNFRQAVAFDGVVFALGNRASFIEPLEATALGLAALQLQVATFWILDQVLGQRDGSIDALNDALGELTDEVASFVAWHYARGSIYDTPFWSTARERFATWLQNRPAAHQTRFQAYAERGQALPKELAFAESIESVDALIELQPAQRDTFGGFLDVSFAKVGRGIGWYAETKPHEANGPNC